MIVNNKDNNLDYFPEVDNLPLARIVTGELGGQTIILLHGITGSASSLADQQRHLTDSGYRVIAIDARGHGMSPRWTTKQLSRAGDQLVDDVVNVIEEIRVVDRAKKGGACVKPVVIGHSMGGATALVLAVRRPDLVSGIVLEDPAQYGMRSNAELLERGQRRVRSCQRQAHDLIDSLKKVLCQSNMPECEALPSLWASQQCDISFLLTGVVAPEMLWHQAMRQISVPCLLITGDREGSARVGVQGLRFVEELHKDNIQTALFPAAGHQVRRMQTRAFNSVVDKWLEASYPAY